MHGKPSKPCYTPVPSKIGQNNMHIYEIINKTNNEIAGTIQAADWVKAVERARSLELVPESDSMNVRIIEEG